MLFPSTLVLMFGRMLRKMRHAVVIYGVMGCCLIGMIGWAVHWDAHKPNPGITAHAADASYSVPSATAPVENVRFPSGRGRAAGQSGVGATLRAPSCVSAPPPERPSRR